MNKIKCAEVKSALSQAFESLRDFIVPTIISGNKYSCWPLFLYKESGSSLCPSDIDTCATSVGIMSFIELVGNDVKNISKDNLDILKNATETILFMRNTDGSWPSVLPLQETSSTKMEGVINDTVFALTALLKLGFLKTQPMVKIEEDPKNHFSLKEVDERISLIDQGIDWLLKNKIKGGWYYTGVEYFEKPEDLSPTLLPTANVIKLFNSTLYYMKDELNKKYHPLVNKIEEAKSEALQWLRSLQVSQNGGFGKKREEKATRAHTSIALAALLSDMNEAFSESILKAIRYLLKQNKNISINFDPEEIFDEYSQVIFLNDNKAVKRNIHHENYLEGLELTSLMNAHNLGYTDKLKAYEKYKFRNLVNKLARGLLNRQVQEGLYRGSFTSRRAAPIEKHPIYAIYHSVESLSLLKKNYEQIYSLKARLITKTLGFILSFTIVAISTFIYAKVYDVAIPKAFVAIFIQFAFAVIGYFLYVFK